MLLLKTAITEAFAETLESFRWLQKVDWKESWNIPNMKALKMELLKSELSKALRTSGAEKRFLLS